MTVLFFILFIMFFGKTLGLAFRLSWGLLKIALYVVFFPLILVGLVFSGLLYLAFPLLIVAGIVSLVAGAA